MVKSASRNADHTLTIWGRTVFKQSGNLCPELPPMNYFNDPRTLRRAPGLFLVGFMGSGKTTVGQLLSQHLGWRFEDLDGRIAAQQGCSIAEIFSNQGERRFRQMEREALLELIVEMRLRPTLAALGGGAFVQADNRSILKESGIPSVFLDASVEDLWERCRSTQERPLAKNKNHFRQLYEARRSSYMEAAIRIDTRGKAVETVAAEVSSWLETLAKEK